MQVGELFVNLGVKGSEKTVGAITGVKQGLKDVASTSLETKAAIVAAMYALERLGAQSAQAGTNIVNFSATTGILGETLQRYQFAAQQAGASNEEMEGSFRTLRASMDAIARGEAPPKSLLMIGQAIGGIDYQRARQDIPYLFDQLQKFAQLKTIDPGQKTALLAQMGQSQNIIAGLERGVFNQTNFSRAPIYSDNEAQKLDHIRAAWANLGTTIEHSLGHLNAKYGGTLIKDITSLIGPVGALVSQLVKLADTLKVFQLIGKAFEGWAGFLGGVSNAVGTLTDATKDPNKKKKLEKNIEGAWTALPEILKSMGQDAIGFFKTPEAHNIPKNIHPMTEILHEKTLVAPVIKPQQSNSGPTQHNNINQHLHFQHDGKDHKNVSDTHKKSIQNAFRQIPTQNQWA